MEFIGAQLASATSITIPAHAAADLLVIGAMNFGNTTQPGTGAGFTSALNNSGSSRAWRLGSRAATASGTASGTWSNATELGALVYRGAAGIGAVAASTSGVPALTLQQPGRSWVAVIEVDSPAPPLPTGTTQRSTGAYWRLSDTNGPVSSWPAQTTPARTGTIAFSIEILPTRHTRSYVTSWGVAARGQRSYVTSWGVAVPRYTRSYVTSWGSTTRVSRSYATSWGVLTFRDWHDAAMSAAYRAAAADPHRVESSRAELVTLAGDVTQWTSDDGTTLEPNFEAAEVEFAGEVPESWSLRSCTITDPAWVPRDPTHPLDPRSQVALKFWHRLWVEALGGWVDVPVGVYRPTRPRITDDGIVRVSFAGRDLLSVAMAGGYGGQVVDVGGMTVDAALRRLFEVVAPALRFTAPATTVTLAAVYQLGKEKPFDDWTALAETAGWIVRADREGIITAGPHPNPSTPALSLVEGADCPVSELSRELSDTQYNRVVVVGTHADLTAPVVGIAEDDDPGSPTYVGRGVVRELLIESDVPTTNTAATNMASMQLGRYLRPSESVSVVIPAQPILGYRDEVELARMQAGAAGSYRVSKWSFALPVPGRAPDLMEVTMMSRQVAR